ncbi:hypothetical protein L198_00065 [Cryptococcus wingfieldii CBS 7118]|uniref:C3HC-type domain-containing protein n=1 Tax=Cryptococcus wingfieldii CBS 7118 TaxID=1295528 RepID=A0A1E3K5B8_9TREE|nr:hypothetical protein L198_00065 [Cryptococcus wingfieldii CBS 7118]ODO08340.1 hypothetical protein L198_00065 [Cryptococcus wingfieldii CBS 7118]
MTLEVDSDLKDAFKLLYDAQDDDWASSDDEPESPAEDAQLEHSPETLYSARITRKRLMSTLDSLFSSGPETKKQRIYNPPSPAIPSFIPSTQAIPDLPSSSTYAPFSPLALLSRLHTFQPFSYSPAHPAALSPVKAALHGWVNEGREGLKCEECKVKWGLGGLGDIKEEGIRGEVVCRLKKGFESRHGSSCPWRINRSPDDLYDKLRHLTHPPITSSLSPLAYRLSSECPALTTIRTSSPIPDSQTKHLISLLSAHSGKEHDVEESAAVMALFGWYPYHPNEPSIRVVLENEVKETELVACRLCHRHIGLWHFKSPSPSSSSTPTPPPSSSIPSKSLDVLDDHLTWCPIRHQPWEASPWWEKTALLGGGDEGSKARMKEGDVKGLLRVSAKLEKKKWRKL